MVSAGVSGQGKTNIHFIDTQRAKVNCETYINLLHKQLPYIFQQDGTSSYTSRASLDYLTENTNQLIKIDEWPPQGADCNPMDYAIWDMLSERVYAGRIHKLTKPKLKKYLKILAGD